VVVLVVEAMKRCKLPRHDPTSCERNPMPSRRAFTWLLGVALLTAGSGFTPADEKDAEKKGTTTGVLTAKGDKPGTWIEVKADGEEKARRYVLHFKGTPELLKAIKETPVDSRVRVEWIFVERFRVLKLEPLSSPKK
jgi:hypothetical protein